MPGDSDADDKGRLDSLEKRFRLLEERLSDVKWIFGAVTGVITVVIGALAIVATVNLDSERALMHTELVDNKADLQKTIEKALGNLEAEPKIDLLALDKHSLWHQEVVVPWSIGEDKIGRAHIRLIIKNEGDGTTGPMYIKLYTKGLRLPLESTDRSDYDFEAFFEPDHLHPNKLPGGVSAEYTLNVSTPSYATRPTGSYNALLRVYYGKETETAREAEAAFTLVVE